MEKPKIKITELKISGEKVVMVYDRKSKRKKYLELRTILRNYNLEPRRSQECINLKLLKNCRWHLKHDFIVCLFFCGIGLTKLREKNHPVEGKLSLQLVV